jgi:hypothetical protein
MRCCFGWEQRDSTNAAGVVAGSGRFPILDQADQ